MKTRVLEIGRYIKDSGATVRKTAVIFGISKSTVHKDVSERLKNISPSLYAEVKEILERNKAQRHIRGGQATKEKYADMRLHGVRT